MITTWSASWSASSRYCVVRMTFVPAATRDADRIPQLEAGARVEAGGRLVEQQDARRAHEAGAEVEPAPHAARVVLDRTVGVVGQEDLGEHRIGGRPGAPLDRGRTAGRSSPGSPGRSSAGSTAALWPASPMTRRTCSGLLDRVDAGDVQRTGVGLQQRRHRPDERGLAGAVGAEHRGDLAGGGDQVEPVEGVDVAVVLGDADRLDRRVDGGWSTRTVGFDGRRGRPSNREPGVGDDVDTDTPWQIKLVM